MATVEVRFSALPGHVRTGRLIAAAVARRSGMPEGGLDDLRLAVGEACARAVDRHRRAAADQPVTMLLSADDACFTVTVVDEAGTVGPVELPDPERHGEQPEPVEPWPSGVGIAVIAGLVDDLAVIERSDFGGSRVRMSWRLPSTRPAWVESSLP
jgi:serine/threonine-protein kinase RsbW